MCEAQGSPLRLSFSKVMQTLPAARSGLRFVALVAVLAGLSLWLALSALAKERVLLSVSLSHPQVGQPVSVRLQIDHAATGACSMRLVAVAP